MDEARRRAGNALKQAQAVAGHGHSGASSDVGVAIALLVAGQRGALLNVRINLEGITDAAYVSAVRVEMERLAVAASAAAQASEALLGSST